MVPIASGHVSLHLVSLPPHIGCYVFDKFLSAVDCMRQRSVLGPRCGAGFLPEGPMVLSVRM